MTKSASEEARKQITRAWATKVPIVDNSSGGNTLHHNTTVPSICF